MSTSTTPRLYESDRMRDKYGRGRYEIKYTWDHYAVITVLPAAWVERHPDEGRYMLTFGGRHADRDQETQYFKTLKLARHAAIAALTPPDVRMLDARNRMDQAARAYLARPSIEAHDAYAAAKAEFEVWEERAAEAREQAAREA